MVKLLVLDVGSGSWSSLAASGGRHALLLPLAGEEKEKPEVERAHHATGEP
jgi:hypothetical protein